MVELGGEVLESDDEDTLVLGLDALQEFGAEGKAAIPKLVAILADAEGENAQIVLATPTEMGADAAPVVPALIAALDRDGTPTEEVLVALVAIGPAAAGASPAILRAMVAHNRGVREYQESNPEVSLSWAPIGIVGAEALASFGELGIPYLMQGSRVWCTGSSCVVR